MGAELEVVDKSSVRYWTYLEYLFIPLFILVWAILAFFLYLPTADIATSHIGKTLTLLLSLGIGAFLAGVLTVLAHAMKSLGLVMLVVVTIMLSVSFYKDYSFLFKHDLITIYEALSEDGSE
jgi:hypothetical protein